MIVIVDSKVANIASVAFALDRLNVAYQVTTDAKVITEASGVILPGVGSAVAAMKNLSKRGLVEVLRNLKQPVLGICLGMQLLYEYSCEGEVDGLGVLPGAITQMLSGDMVLPHMGWNQLKFKPNLLLQGLKQDEYVYFVHSFARIVDDNCIAECNYGMPFTAVCQRDNFYGTQFHPERSSKAGSLILNNFVRLVCKSFQQ